LPKLKKLLKVIRSNMKPYLEKHFQRDFTKWYKKEAENLVWPSLAYVLKRTTGGTVAFSKFEDQQLPALQACCTQNGLHHELTDASLGINPFDGFLLRYADAYVGIVFYANDKAKREFWFIEIDDVMALKTVQKSITLKNCQKLGFELKL